MTMQWHTETCCKCKAPFAISMELYNIARERCEQFTFYCPHGHPQHYARGESEANLLRRERDRLLQDHARLIYENKQAKEEVEKAARAMKRMKKRASAGVCPCCNRTFGNMAAHMKTKHPEYSSGKVVKLKTA